MRLVEIEEGAVPLGEVGEAGDVGLIAVHAEHGLGEDEARGGVARAALQQILEMVEVGVVVADLAHAGGGAAGVDAGVVEAVREDARRRAERAAVEERRQHRPVRLIAGVEDQRRLGPLAGGEARLDPLEGLEVAGDETRGAGAGAPPLGPFLPATDERRVLRQAEVVVGGEVQHLAPAEARHAAPRRPDGAQLAPASGTLEALEDPGVKRLVHGVTAGDEEESPFSGGTAHMSTPRGPGDPRGADVLVRRTWTQAVARSFGGGAMRVAGMRTA